MRRFALVMPLFLLGTAPPVSPPPPSDIAPPIATMVRALPECRTFQTTAIKGRAMFQKLGELPSGNAYRAVLLAGPDGCPDPIIASYGHGSPNGPRPASRR